MRLCIALLLGISLASATTVEGNTHGTAVWRRGNVIAAFTDGWLCYGTDVNGSKCHRAIAKPTYREIQ